MLLHKLLICLCDFSLFPQHPSDQNNLVVSSGRFKASFGDFAGHLSLFHFSSLLDWCSWTASTHAASSFWCNSSNIPTHSCSDCSGDQPHLHSLSLPHVVVHKVARKRSRYQGKQCRGRAGMGGEQGRAGCSLNRERGRPASPREITLFWARGDDIMTDGDEDVGAEGRKRYLPQWHRGDGDVHINTCGTHWRSLILYSSGLEQLSLPTGHNHTHIYTHLHTATHTKPLTCLGLGGGCHLKVKARQSQARSLCVTVLHLPFSTAPRSCGSYTEESDRSRPRRGLQLMRWVRTAFNGTIHIAWILFEAYLHSQ